MLDFVVGTIAQEKPGMHKGVNIKIFALEIGKCVKLAIDLV